MTMPTLIVEVGFSAALTGTALHLDDTMRGRLDTGTLAPDTLLVDVSEFVVSVNTRRGATRSDGPYLRYEAGTCTITLRNDDRRFDPTNLTSPYAVAGVTQVEPMRAVRIRADYGGVTYPLWRGFTDEWTVAYDGPDSSYATVTCFDAFGVFSAHNRLAIAAAGAGETTGARIGRILDSINWPASDRMVSAGEETVQATTLADNVLTEMLLTNDTELGEFYMDTQGRTVFRSRSATYTDVRSRYPLALFGDQPTEGVETTVNLATDPSVEVSTDGWRATGTVAPTIARDSTRAQFGTWSLLATWGTGGSLPGVAYDITGLTVGRTYTISMYVYVPSGSPVVALISSSVWGDATTVTDQWVRLSWTGLAVATTRAIGLWPFGSPTAGQQVWIDGLQVEEGEVAGPYVDGDQPAAEWDGFVHASTSRRLPELDYGDLGITYDALSITNQVSAARAGGTEQVASEAASISEYLTRSHKRSDLLMETDAEALMWADQVVARRSQPELRVTSLLLKPQKDPARLWAQAFGRKIGDRVRVVRRPPGGGDPIVRDAWVRGIAHNLQESLDWRTTFVLEQARDIEDALDTFSSTRPPWGPTLNANPYFETNASSWTTVGATSFVRSTAQFHEGTASGLLTPNGAATATELYSESVPVSAGSRYRPTAWVRCAVARNVQIYTVWFDSGGGFLSSSSATTAVAATTWTLLAHAATAPVGAAQGRLGIVMDATPLASHLLYVDEATLESEAGGWGSADTGQAWTDSGTNRSDFTAASGGGRHSVTANFTVVNRSVLDVSWRNLTLLLPSIVWPISPTGDFVRTEVLLRYVDASNYIRLQVAINVGNTIDLRIESVTGGVGTALAAVATGITHTAGTALKLRADAVGSLIRARLWKSGTTEPTTWTASGTDSNQRTGAIGILSLAGPGNTNTKPFNVVYDDLTAQSLHAWT